MSHVRNAVVYVVNDDSAERASIAQIVESLGMRTEYHMSVDSFLRAFDPTLPGCLVANMLSPGISDLKLQARLGVEETSIPITIMPGCTATRMGVMSLKRGLVQFLTTPIRADELSNAVQEAIAQDGQLRSEPAARESCLALLAQLTDDERAVLRGVLLGKTNAEVAVDLDVSLRTVQLRLAGLLKKLAAKDRKTLFKRAAEGHWLEILSGAKPVSDAR